jgi:hypothetical protein
MAVTVKVNGVANSLVHKGSNGISTATMPDVCRTPSPGGPVPIPYPNVSRSATLSNGSTTVTADGGMMIANQGSQFSASNGDEAGSLGGVKSGTFIKESTWITYSFDVKIEGRGACRLTDKKFQNHGNTVDLAGETQAAIHPQLAPELKIICETVCKCDRAPATGTAGQDLKQQCVTATLQALDNAAGNRSTIKPEINYNMTTVPPSPIMSGANPLKGTSYLPQRTVEIPGFRPGTGMVRRPDAVIVRNPAMPPTQDNLRGVVEIKFPPDARDVQQIAAYQRIAGASPVVELSPAQCDCPQKERRPVFEPVEVRKPSWIEVTLLALALAALVADNATGVGAADDVAIPAIIARIAMAF